MAETKQGFLETPNLYMYQELVSGNISAAIGLDEDDDHFKISVQPAPDANPNDLPSLEIDPVGNFTVTGGAGVFEVAGTGMTNLGTFQMLSFTEGVVQSDNAGVLSSTAGNDGEILIGATGGAPAWASLTAGTNITITPGSNSITIDASGGGGGMTWTEVVGTSQSMAVANGYILNNAGLVTATLPAVAAVGDIVAIVGKGAGGWKMAQNAGQTVHFDGSDTTTGAGGSLASTVRYDCVEVICTTANTDFVVRMAVGNLTIV